MKRYAISLAVVLTLFSTTALGQQGSSELRGLVTDPQDAVLPGVTVIQEPPWRMIYRIPDSKTVEIHGVFDGRRSLEDILTERLLQT